MKKASFALSPSALSSILALELTSIREKRERGFLVCNQRVHPIDSATWKDGKLDISIDASEITAKCGQAPFLVGHTHMLFTAKPSREDFQYKQSGIPADGFCTAGADQVMCFDRNDKVISSHTWGKSFAKAFTDQHGHIFDGKNLYCDKMHNKYYCELNDSQGKVVPVGIFESIMTQGGTQALNHSSADFAFFSHLPDENMRCFAQAGNPDLMCQVGKKEY